MRTLIKYLIQSIVCCLIISCNGIPGQEVNIPAKSKFKTQVTMNAKSIINVATNDCEIISGVQYDISNNEKGVMIKATDINSGYSINLYVYYSTLSQVAPGAKLPVWDEYNSFPAFRAVVIQNEKLYESWQTDLDGRVNGYLTVKTFDSSTGLASFEVSFDAKKFNSSGTKINDQITSFSGVFENVPIFPDEDSWANCSENNPGFSSGSNNGNSGSNGGNTGNTGNSGGNTSSNTSLEYINKTHYAINITLNGITKTAPYNGSAIFTGTASSKATGTATSNGKTSSGTQVGLKITWNLNHTFPTTGTQLVDLSAGSEVFFLQIINQSQTPMNKVIVNNGLQSQTVDNISIPTDGKLYNIGYYKAFTNSNVRAEGNNNRYWTWPNLNLKFENNQLKTLTATGN